MNRTTFKNATPQQEKNFTDDFLELDSLRIFSRKIFQFCKDKDGSLDININVSSKREGTLINIGMQKGATMEEAQEALRILQKDEELVRLEHVYKALQELNIESEYDFSNELSKIREKAMKIKDELYPEL